MPEPNGESPALIRLFEAAKLMPTPHEVGARIRQLRLANGEKSPRDLSRQAIRSHTVRLTGTGVVASLPGTIPFVGTAAQVGVTGATITAELWTILRGLATMQLTVAGLHGHDLFAPERKDELLIVWGLETGAIVPATEAGKRLGTKIAIKQFNQKVSGQVFKKINQKLGTTVVTKWGAKRGGVAVGRLIPFGVGAAVGGGANYLTVRSFGTACLKFYGEIEPGNGHIFVPA
jgi:hypothetical protein